MPVRPRHAVRSQRPGLLRHWTLWVGFPLALLLILGYVFVLKSGRWLVATDPFEKTEWAAVLAGESRETERADEALRLYLDGRIDSLIYSSNRILKRRWASELLTEYLAEEGFPRDKMFEFRQEAFSTLEEARLLVRQFRYQNLDTVVIITVNFHTARSRRIFRELAQGYPHVLVHAAETPLFDPDTWWSSREGRKIWLLEWAKTVATWFELMGETPEVGKAESNALVGGIYGEGAVPSLPAVAPADSVPAPAADSAASAQGDTALEPDVVSADTPAKGVDSSVASLDSDPAPEVRSEKADRAVAGKVDKAEKEIQSAREDVGNKEELSSGKARRKATPKGGATQTESPAKDNASKARDKSRKKLSRQN